MKKLGFIFFVSIILINSCTMSKHKVDYIIQNARIYTVDSDFSIAGSMAVADGKIQGIGSKEDIFSEYSSETIIDLKNSFIYPGFIDAHCHFYGYGLGDALKADLKGTLSFEEVMDRLKQHAENHDEGWLLGRGWDHNDWPEKIFPTKERLDELFPGRPVLLTRIDGHAALANSYALEMAGITASTRIDGGDIIMFNGEPGGILIDNAISLVEELIPEANDADIAEALLLAQQRCFDAGLTSIVDAGLDYNVIRIIDSLNKSGDLLMRIDAMISPTEENFREYMDKGIYETPYLRVGSLKLYADGALGSRGACLLEEYDDDAGNYGLILETEDYYRKMCQRAYDAGYQVNTHAIGDSGVRLMLDVYADILQGPNDRRWRIEHSQIIDEKDFSKYGAYNIIPSVQATHATSDMYWAADRIGPERIKNAYAYKKLLEQNGWLANGTDFPIEEIYPLHTFYASVARKDLSGFPPEGFQMENALSREETLRSMTIWAAKSSFREKTSGSLEKGKYADFIILDRDIMKVDADQIPEAEVVATFSGGRQVAGEPLSLTHIANKGQ